GNLEEAASRLFSGLRFLASQQPTFDLTGVAVQPIPPQGLGRAIQDRLNRAAAPRPAEPDLS
ncbi:MAG: Sua5 family C-terminal domain-containing protein, partial [Acetobacter persici]